MVLNTNDAACFGLGRLLGTGSIANVGDAPLEMQNLQIVNLNNRKIQSISVGQQHSCVVLLLQTVAVCWGEGGSGVLGYDNQDEVLAPESRVVLLPSKFKVQTIRTYASHSCALSTKGGATCFGSKLFGRLGEFALGPAAAIQCLGCGKHQMQQLKALNFGCDALLTPAGTCPYNLPTSNQCAICKAKWSQTLCSKFNQKCRWNRSLNKCQPR